MVQFLLNNNFSYANLTDLLGLPEINGLGVFGIVRGGSIQLTEVKIHPHTQGPDNLCLCFGGNNVLIVNRVPHINCQLDVNRTSWENNFLRALASTLREVCPSPTDEIDNFEELFSDDIVKQICNDLIELVKSVKNSSGNVLSSWITRMIGQSIALVYGKKDQRYKYTSGMQCVILGGMFLGVRAYVVKRSGDVPRGVPSYDYNSLVTNIYADADRQRVYGKVFVYSMCFMLSMLHCLNLKENVQ